MNEKFLGFVRRDGAKYGGTVAEFDFSDGQREVLDAVDVMIRRHNLRHAGLATPEEDQAIADFQRCLDSQHWFDAERDFLAWLDEWQKASS